MNASTATLIPEKENGAYVSHTYTAHFKEASEVKLHYEANTGGSIVTPISGYEEVAPVTGIPSGAKASANPGYHFVN